MLLVNERSDAHVDSVALSVYQLRRDREDLATVRDFFGAKALSCQLWGRTSTNRTHIAIASAHNADETSRVAKIDASAIFRGTLIVSSQMRRNGVSDERVESVVNPSFMELHTRSQLRSRPGIGEER
jgi:hypothetical protein